MPTVTFSLKSSQWDALEAVSDPGESRNLAAKRIFLGALGDPESSAPDPDAFEYLQHQVERLEEALGICPDPAGADRLDKLEERLVIGCARFDKLEERLAALESDLKSLAQQPDLDPPPAPPSRLPKATRRQAQSPTTTEEN